MDNSQPPTQDKVLQSMLGIGTIDGPELSTLLQQATPENHEALKAYLRYKQHCVSGAVRYAQAAAELTARKRADLMMSMKRKEQMRAVAKAQARDDMKRAKIAKLIRPMHFKKAAKAENFRRAAIMNYVRKKHAQGAQVNASASNASTSSRSQSLSSNGPSASMTQAHTMEDETFFHSQGPIKDEEMED